MNVTKSTILIALGSNLPFLGHDSEHILFLALQQMEREGVSVQQCSPWYRSAPVPPSGQPDFINGVAALDTDLDPVALLSLLHSTERAFGRVRGSRNAARTLDLDLIDYRGRITSGKEGAPVLPHPRMQDRAFVLVPLRDVVPDWRHPASGDSIDTLIGLLPEPWGLEPL
ncbi:MAG: 2-amino-4-hydroxy-6-hydroxymethyldihydropteridine diphosphokinase [Alphaproteobacteria bacterium]